MRLNTADVYVIGLFFSAMLVIGIWSYFKSRNAEDYFVAGGKLPWWLAGISHHVSGYSGAVFVAFAGLAYTYGFSVYVWWALTIGIGIIASARLFPVIWVRLRKKLHIQSPLEYLDMRYNLLTQQVMAWSGVLLKLFDVGAKWAAIAVLLNVFTGMSIVSGVLVSGGISLVYITFGGYWAVILTDFTQFVVQLLGGLTMFIVVLIHLGGIDSLRTIWDQLPPESSHWFNKPYTVWFAIAFLGINFLSYNGGTWNLATKYISTRDEKQGSKAAMISGILYLVWPLILFFPMWAAPIILPGLSDPTQSYGLLTLQLLPAGLVGLVVASLFAHTMAMTSSDVNTIAAVITRDILPVLTRRPKDHVFKNSLLIARATSFTFTFLTILVAIQYKRFGGVLGLIVTWFEALLGPIAVPMLLGLLPPFRRCGSAAALLSIGGGFSAFIFTKCVAIGNLAWEVSLPLLVSLVIYMAGGLLNLRKPLPEKVKNLMDALFAGKHG